MMRSYALCSWILMLAFSSTTLAQGALENLRLAVRTDSNESSSDTSSKSSEKQSHSSSNCDDDDDDSDGLSFLIMKSLLTCPFTLPKILTQDTGLPPLFESYPYVHSKPGYLRVPDSSGFDPNERVKTLFGTTRRSTDWAARLTLEDSDDFERLNRYGGNLMLTSSTRFGLITEWKGVTERFRDGGHDSLLLGKTNVLYNFAQHEQVQFYAGLGYRLLSDPRQTDLGFNATYGVDWFPSKPLVLSAWIDAGTLGKAGVFESRITVGVIRRGVEGFVGYSYLNVGGDVMQGPLLGLRFWF